MYYQERLDGNWNSASQTNEHNHYYRSKNAKIVDHDEELWFPSDAVRNTWDLLLCSLIRNVECQIVVVLVFCGVPNDYCA